LAVNLSDIAAMGGQPRWAVVGLTLPSMDEDWVAGFARGLDAIAQTHKVAVVGGDVTRGPRAVSVQITGTSAVPPIRRDAACAGDDVWVSGRLGEAAGGLAVWQAGQQGEPRWTGLVDAFLRPVPRLCLGQALQGIWLAG
jgi:thiamine-monophosphate kinase